jgi:hypothetical protein
MGVMCLCCGDVTLLVMTLESCCREASQDVHSFILVYLHASEMCACYVVGASVSGC